MTIEKAKRIITKLQPTIDKVGVFIEPEIESILKTVKSLKLDYAQIHSYNPAPLVTGLKKRGIKVIESCHITRASDYKRVAKSKADIVQFDNRTKGPGGGTGKRFDWSIRPPRKIPNLMLAGGINSENVTEGLKIFKPLIIDVNSGVETSPGIKSAAKLKYFFKVCNGLRYGAKN